MGEIQSVIELYVEVQDWEEAFMWAEKHPEYKQLVYVPYATSLAEQDKFLQAQKGKFFLRNMMWKASSLIKPLSI